MFATEDRQRVFKLQVKRISLKYMNSTFRYTKHDYLLHFIHELKDSQHTNSILLFIMLQLPSKVGAGLVNLNNTCFFNAVLQTLSHTIPLIQLLISHSDHPDCPLCLFKKHLQLAFSTYRLEPLIMIAKMSHIFKKWRMGRQEDAHQFMRYLIEFLMRDRISENKVSLEHMRTNPLFNIFGGYFQSTVLCEQCQRPSITTEHFLDLSLDLFECDSITDCLKKFFRKEKLSGFNLYNCQNCKKQVKASKYYRIKRLPKILTIQLKRFSHNLTKIGKRIYTDHKLDLSNFCKDGLESKYELSSVIVHQGRTCFSGHYYAYVRFKDQWYLMDDSRVAKVPISAIYKDCPYILIYQRIYCKREQSKSKMAQKELKNGVKEQVPKLLLKRTVSMASMISKESICSLSGRQKMSKLTSKLKKVHEKCLIHLRKRQRNA